LRTRARFNRKVLPAIWAIGLALWALQVSAQTVEVPIRLQAELLSKVAVYDRTFMDRARGHALVLILVRPNHPESLRIGEQIHSELSVLPQLGGLRHTEEIVAYSSAQGLTELCKRRAPAIVYLSAGFADQMESLASALEGISILTVAALASYVPKRAVLGFDAESGRPKLVVNLGQARRQKVAFKPELLTLARVLP
jgi:hypothetical protein